MVGVVHWNEMCICVYCKLIKSLLKLSNEYFEVLVWVEVDRFGFLWFQGWCYYLAKDVVDAICVVEKHLGVEIVVHWEFDYLDYFYLEREVGCVCSFFVCYFGWVVLDWF